MNQMIDNISRVSDLYAQRFGIERSSDWYLLKIQEELGEMCLKLGSSAFKEINSVAKSD